ncbi:hypothetical protein ACTFIV_003133 [Dictyostelium citrinum]
MDRFNTISLFILLSFIGIVLGQQSPQTYNVLFSTTTGDVEIFVNRSYSPYGSDRFYALIQDGFYTDNAFFRVIQTPLFVAQFGISPSSSLNEKWNVTIPNDPVVISNTAGTITFAAEEENNQACCRTTQLFINYADNSFLDSAGFSPFGRVISGFNNTLKFYGGYGEEPDQSLIYSEGNSYLQENFPLLSYLNSVKIITEQW